MGSIHRMLLFLLLLALVGDCNLLDPIDTHAHYDIFPSEEHPLKPPAGSESLLDKPIQTNKFYTNFLLGQQNYPVWTHPYTLWWSTANKGMAISHTVASNRRLGRHEDYLFSPSRSEMLNFNSIELNDHKKDVKMKVGHADHLSVTSILYIDNDQINNSSITFPLSLGMGFVTAIYNNLTPVIRIPKKVEYVKKDPYYGDGKYIIKLQDQSKWLMYVFASSGKDEWLSFELQKDRQAIVGTQPVESDLVIQIAALPDEAYEALVGESIFDDAAGTFIVGADLELEDNREDRNQDNDDDKLVYRIAYDIAGKTRDGYREVLVFALPHHVESFTDNMISDMTALSLDSTVFGQMTGTITTNLEMQESLTFAKKVGFMPWFGKEEEDNKKNPSQNFDDEIVDLIIQSAKDELKDENKVKQETNGSLNYFCFKALDKYALIAFSLKYAAGDDVLANEALNIVKKQFQIFAENKETAPYLYDTTWKGIVSSSGIKTGPPDSDFGNSYYNDHHFHYGYLIHAAAIIGFMEDDNSWIEDNREFVETFIRDVANPSNEDPDFPPWRSFDWFTGKSWARGLFLALDGKDEESTSEDYHFLYGMKLWGKLTGDEDMETRADLMLAVIRRSIHNYILYSDGNQNVPAEIANNKVCGILSDNKIEYHTYFGGNPEFIHGIHMLPLTPASQCMRTQSFSQQEWDARVQDIYNDLDPRSGWRSILKLNQALFDPASSLAFFASPDFDYQCLDDGLSRTWALTLAAGLLETL